MPQYQDTQSQCHCTMALSFNATVPRHSVSVPLYHGTQSQFHSSKVSMPQYHGTQSQFYSSKVPMPQYHGTQPQCNHTKTASLTAMVPTYSMLMPQHHTPSLTANIILPYVTHFLSLITSWFYSKFKNSSVFVNWPNSVVP